MKDTIEAQAPLKIDKRVIVKLATASSVKNRGTVAELKFDSLDAKPETAALTSKCKRPKLPGSGASSYRQTMNSPLSFVNTARKATVKDGGNAG